MRQEIDGLRSPVGDANFRAQTNLIVVELEQRCREGRGGRGALLNLPVFPILGSIPLLSRVGEILFPCPSPRAAALVPAVVSSTFPIPPCSPPPAAR